MCIGYLLFLHLFCKEQKSQDSHTHSTSKSSKDDSSFVHSDQAVPTARVHARSDIISTTEPACHAQAGITKTPSETDCVSLVQVIPQAYPVRFQPINVSVKPVIAKLDLNACRVRPVRIKVSLETQNADHVPEIRVRFKEAHQTPLASVIPDSPDRSQGLVCRASLEHTNQAQVPSRVQPVRKKKRQNRKVHSPLTAYASQVLN